MQYYYFYILFSLITEELCRSLSLTTNPKASKSSLYMVDGTKFASMGEIETSIELEVTGVETQMHLQLMKTMPTPLLLGRDFAKQINLVMDFCMNSFWLNDGTGDHRIKWPMLGLPSHEPLQKEDSDPPEFDTEPTSTTIESLHLDNLLEEFHDVITENPGRTDIVNHRIYTGDSQPLRSPVYRLSGDRRQSLRKQLDEMLADGRIVPSCSPWASPVVMVPKKEIQILRRL